MKVFIISDDTRILQEILFLDIVNKFQNFEICYCAINKKNYNKFRGISFFDVLRI